MWKVSMVPVQRLVLIIDESAQPFRERKHVEVSIQQKKCSMLKQNVMENAELSYVKATIRESRILTIITELVLRTCTILRKVPVDEVPCRRSSLYRRSSLEIAQCSRLGYSLVSSRRWFSCYHDSGANTFCRLCALPEYIYPWLRCACTQLVRPERSRRYAPECDRPRTHVYDGRYWYDPTVHMEGRTEQVQFTTLPTIF